MNYLKVYNELIEKRKLNPPKENFEKHHIYPRSLFPELAKDQNNLVNLTYREHYLVHHLLYRYYKSIGDKKATSKMACAWFRMCYGKDGLKLSLNQFEKAKKAMSKSKKGLKFSEEIKKKLSESHKNISIETRQKLSKALKGKTPWNKGKKLSEETRNKISLATKGKNNPFYGKKHTEETKSKISKSKKGKCSRYGKDNPMYGKHLSEETKQKIRNALKNYWNKDK